jgi:AraC-like DNA-binding protein
LPLHKDRVGRLTEAPPSTLPSETDLPLQVHELTRLVVTYLRQHYAAEQLSRCQIASHIAVCERHLTYIFRRDLGITPWEYLTRFRIEQAKILLHVTDLTATEIAGRVGYNDGAYFCRVFHRETGRSPSAFRRQYRCRQDLHGLSQLVPDSGKSLPFVQDSRAPKSYYIAATQRTAVQL